MSLDTVVADIREEAEDQAEQILADAEAEAESIRAEAETEAAEIHETAEAETENEIARLREQRLSSAKLEAKQQRLEARRDVLGTVRDRVEAAIEDLPEADRRELTEALLADAVSEFDEAAVYCRPEDESLVEDLLEDYDGFELAGETDCLGGVVLEGSDGRIRVDNTFDSTLETVWDEHLKELSDVLFEEQ
ncbi:V-type ATP synthase subunit E [Halodesulfurarchaeum sp. HSR-GB]|uniref:V-type ATP synthase subunit E n=1 Tax=Halodesulfurarchaeum sp. HSR-GB TaxID=3074077 RepID=UPI0028632215|nr:V-type ATP synthase subunit E [Halodesulfurarchaeum sp. HSR-GB]MDR5656411.1 V-type ATP synthase subunit E [Halodesulfurarchaeum sp. HSR-GB]